MPPSRRRKVMKMLIFFKGAIARHLLDGWNAKEKWLFFSFCVVVVAVWDPRLSLSLLFLLFPFRKDPSSFGGREPLHCIFHGTFLPSFSSSDVVVVVVTVDFSFWAASSLPLPYLIKMVTAVISCCERRDATRRYGRPFPFSLFFT